VSQHSAPGGVWPHWSGLADAARLDEIRDYAVVHEERLHEQALQHLDPALGLPG
jgi:hypothetical protein